MCNMTQAQVRQDSFTCMTCMTWLIHTGDMTHPHVWHDVFACVTCLMHMCGMSHSNVWHDSYTFVTRLIHMYDMNHSHVRHDSFKCLACLTHFVWQLIHVRHDSFKWHVRHDSFKWHVRHDSFKCLACYFVWQLNEWSHKIVARAQVFPANSRDNKYMNVWVCDHAISFDNSMSCHTKSNIFEYFATIHKCNTTHATTSFKNSGTIHMCNTTQSHACQDSPPTPYPSAGTHSHAWHDASTSTTWLSFFVSFCLSFCLSWLTSQGESVSRPFAK